MEYKDWYKSKAVWTAILGAILSSIPSVSQALGHPIEIPQYVYGFLASFGLYALRDGQGKQLM